MARNTCEAIREVPGGQPDKETSSNQRTNQTMRLLQQLQLQLLLHSYLSNWRVHACTAQHGQRKLLVASFLCHHGAILCIHQESYRSLRSRGRTPRTQRVPCSSVPAPRSSSSSTTTPPLHPVVVAGRAARAWTSARCTWTAQSHTRAARRDQIDQISS